MHRTMGLPACVQLRLPRWGNTQWLSLTCKEERTASASSDNSGFHSSPCHLVNDPLSLCVISCGPGCPLASFQYSQNISLHFLWGSGSQEYPSQIIQGSILFDLLLSLLNHFLHWVLLAVFLGRRGLQSPILCQQGWYPIHPPLMQPLSTRPVNPERGEEPRRLFKFTRR